MDNRFIDPGGSQSSYRDFPPLNSYTHNSKRPRYIEDNNYSRNSVYLTFKVCNSAKTLKAFSPFKINDALNKINSEWKFISTNRERDIITILVLEEIISQEFIGTKTITIGGDNVDVSFELHTGLNFSKGTVFCPEIIKMTNEEIVESLKEQNVHEIYRFQKRNSSNEFYDTGLFVVTFNGTDPPKNLKVAYLSVPVATYYPNPMQCNHCFKLGHILKKCKNISLNKACVKCGAHTEHEDCTLFCVNCNEAHSNKFKGCPEYKKEKLIIKLKVDQNLSFPEARRRCLANKGASSFAEAADRGELVNIVGNLNKKVDELIKENLILKNSNSLFSQEVSELKDSINDSAMNELQKQFDEFKEQVEVSTVKLNEEIKNQKVLHEAQLQQHIQETDIIKKKLKEKNDLLEQVNKYLEENGLYPEDLKTKGITVSHELQQKVNVIEIDDDESTSSKKKPGRSRNFSPAAAAIAKIKNVEKVTVKRLENKSLSQGSTSQKK